MSSTVKRYYKRHHDRATRRAIDLAGIMSRISLAVTMLSLCLVSCEIRLDDRNTKWRENNELLRNMDAYFRMLARTTSDAKDKRKRFMSVLSLAIVYDAENNQPTKLQRVQEAVAKTRTQLDKPADALSGDTVAFLSLLRAVIDQPINDIKVSCKPNTEESECVSNLKMYHEKNLQHCNEYDRNLELYEKTKDFFNDPQFIDFSKDVLQISDMNDDVALSFFTYIVMVKYPDLLAKGRDVYRTRAKTSYPCSSRNLPLY